MRAGYRPVHIRLEYVGTPDQDLASREDDCA